MTHPHYKPLLHGGLLAAIILSTAPLSLHAGANFLGVAAGDATSTEAVIWTRPAGTPSAGVPLTAQVSTDRLDFSAAASYPVVADAPTDYTAKLLLTGLAPNTRYYYRFSDGVNTSETGTFKTAPAPSDKVGIRFAFSGDMDGLMRPYPLADSLPSLGLDFYVNCGDVIYENASKVAGNIGLPYTNSPSVTLSGSSASLNGLPQAGTTFATRAQLFADYNKKYREQFLPVNAGGQNGLESFYAGQGNYTLNDNHELGNRQYINGGAPAGGSVGGASGNDMPTGRGVDARANGAGNPLNINDAADAIVPALTSADFMNRSIGFQTLQRVYLNYQPIRENRANPALPAATITAPRDPRTDGTPQLYFAQRWGQHAIYVQLDDRSYRDIRLKTADGSADDTGVRADNVARTYLGKTQLSWVEQTLRQAELDGVTWKFVALSDPIDQIGSDRGSTDGDPHRSQLGWRKIIHRGLSCGAERPAAVHRGEPHPERGVHGHG
jgi:hypothetical protein